MADDGALPLDPLWYKDAIIYELHVKTFHDSDGDGIGYYFDVNPNYGSLGDFKAFLAAAHERGLRVITELVINHSSDQCAWFQASRRAVAARAVAIGDPGRPETPLASPVSA